MSHKEIRDAAVIGVPDEKTGEKPRAYVVSASKSLTESDVKHFIEGIEEIWRCDCYIYGDVFLQRKYPRTSSSPVELFLSRKSPSHRREKFFDVSYEIEQRRNCSQNYSVEDGLYAICILYYINVCNEKISGERHYCDFCSTDVAIL